MGSRKGSSGHDIASALTDFLQLVNHTRPARGWAEHHLITDGRGVHKAPSYGGNYRQFMVAWGRGHGVASIRRACSSKEPLTQAQARSSY